MSFGLSFGQIDEQKMKIDKLYLRVPAGAIHFIFYLLIG